MEAIVNAATRNVGTTVGIILLVVIGVASISILSLSPEQQEKLKRNF